MHGFIFFKKTVFFFCFLVKYTFTSTWGFDFASFLPLSAFKNRNESKEDRHVEDYVACQSYAKRCVDSPMLIMCKHRNRLNHPAAIILAIPLLIYCLKEGVCKHKKGHSAKAITQKTMGSMSYSQLRHPSHLKHMQWENNRILIREYREYSPGIWHCNPEG